jgi:hypothetical protein
MSDHVWYASYGSNLLRKRFMAYIQGGTAPGASIGQVGCTDQTPPKRDRGILILHELFFAEAIPQWEDLGVAFLREEKEVAAKTLGRMYLISRDQFREVVLQENGHRRMEADVGLDLEKTIREGRSELPGELYGTVLHLGEEEGKPIFTFTASWGEEQALLNRPGPKYLKVIIRGLKETFGLSNPGVMDYLRDVPGVQGVIPEEELARVVEEVEVLT